MSDARRILSVPFFALLLVSTSSASRAEPKSLRSSEPPARQATSQLAGSVSCRDCHERFYKLWAPSHHGLAMQPYSAEFARQHLRPHSEEIKIGEQHDRADVQHDQGCVIERGPKGERKLSIRPRYGAAGKHGSIAVVERFIRTLKDEVTRWILIPPDQARFRKEVDAFLVWYNEHHPHRWLDGRTPNEVYFGLRPANRRPRIEPRKGWPRKASCAKPRTQIAGQPGDRFKLDVNFHNANRHLPIVSLKRAA